MRRKPVWPRDGADAIQRTLAVEGGHLFVGPGGYTLHYGQGSSQSGYDNPGMKARCVSAGVPVIDARAVPCGVAFGLASAGPMIAVGRPPGKPPYGPLDYAPLAAVADAYRAAGAEVLNLALPGGSMAVARTRSGRN